MQAFKASIEIDADRPQRVEPMTLLTIAIRLGPMDIEETYTLTSTEGDYFPESLRSYIHAITQKSFTNREKGYWLGTWGMRVRLAIQLKKNQRVNSMLIENLKNRLNTLYGDLIDAEFIPFYKITHQMGIDFERKFNHLSS
ncbi:hypothetical protein GF407_11155 [candidate division KSB1 bacterium]|nr:hypothetical protein [candidate division KSB1 bacterium]